MRYILLVLTLLNINTFSAELSFEELRKSEKALVLKEFKKLFKHRKNIHYNIRQTMKHARSKNLHKNHISFFQAKNSNYEQTHQMELSDVFFGTEIICKDNCQSTSTETDSSLEILPETPHVPEDISPDNPIIEEENNNIRNSIQNPWMRK